MTTLTTAIAQHLNVAETAIIKVEEWANVLFTVVKGLGARFVSKKVKPQEGDKTMENNTKDVVELMIDGKSTQDMSDTELYDAVITAGDEDEVIDAVWFRFEKRIINEENVRQELLMALHQAIFENDETFKF